MRMVFFNKLKVTKRISTFNIVLTAIIALVLFLVALGNNGQYQSQITLVMIPRSELTILQAEQIAQNMEILPSRLAFYEKILKDNAGMADHFSTQESDQRKKSWNEILKIEREKNSLVFDLTATANNKTEAEVIARNSATTLFAVMANYYDVKNDLDLRIVDGPITGKLRGNWLLIIILCLLASAVIVTIINLVFFKLEDFFADVMPSRTARLPKIKIPQKWYAVNEKKAPQPNVEKEEIPAILTVKKYQAPANLPVAPVEIQNTIISEAPTTTNDAEKREPTDEELKQRLNELLHGGL